MDGDRKNSEERRLRLEAMIEEFRAAQRRLLVKRERVQRTRAVAAREVTACVDPNSPGNVH